MKEDVIVIKEDVIVIKEIMAFYEAHHLHLDLVDVPFLVQAWKDGLRPDVKTGKFLPSSSCI